MAFYGRPSLNRGDYYRGDYYRGDPNIFGSIFGGLKTIVGGAIGAATGFLKGGPVGGVTGAIGGLVGGGRSQYEGSLARAAQDPNVLAAGGSGPPAGFIPHAALPAVMPGGSRALGPGTALMIPAGGAAGMRRTHPNRSTYVTRGGGTSHWPVGLQIHPKGTVPVPSRRMNVGNPRALRRAIRRVSGFAKLVHRVKRAVSRANSAVGNVHRRSKGVPRRR